jgi:hypothetical protein
VLYYFGLEIKRITPEAIKPCLLPKWYSTPYIMPWFLVKKYCTKKGIGCHLGNTP